jgi:hypothetical protein
MLNRAAITLKLTQIAVDWVNTADVDDDDFKMNVSQANEESTVYLIPSEAADNIEMWLEQNYKILFENELENWYTDEKLWPRYRTYKMFKNWFKVDCNSVVLDLVNDVLIDDEF